MALRPFTAEEIKAALATPPRHLFDPWAWSTMFEPKHQFVTYRAALNRADYEQRDTFYRIGPASPSDCHWMVPGVTQK